MSRRSLLLLLALGAAALVVLRRHGLAAGRVEVVYEDGSLESIPGGSPQAERMLSLAREAISAARGAA